ncbi:MAG TPA: hypothetical protein VJV39_08950 [Dongiaceae bacterium]|nr:hypothetical protein [Dongiaceae bacterium]
MARYTPHHADALAFWADESGQVHICESNAPLANELLVWTLCDREVESGKGFLPTRHDEVTCRKCMAADGVLKHRAKSASTHSTLR